MLNRLMFVYFIRRQGFLDTTSEDALEGDTQYLRHRLEKMQTKHSKDRFYSFYRYFLLKLFHDGLSRREHSAELEKLLGKIPYLNGGLFDVHQLERHYPDIQIPDEAFERIFDFFEEYDWHLEIVPVSQAMRLTRMYLVISSRSTSTRSRWGPTIPKRILPSTSAKIQKIGCHDTNLQALR